MNSIKMTIAFIVSFSFSSAIFAQVDNKEQLIVPLSSPGKPYSLTMDLIDGSIKVTGYEGKDIIIDISTDSERTKREKGMVNGMKRISSAGALDVTAEENNNKINISAGESHKIVLLKIPQGDVKLKLGTVNNGDITVSNVSGELEINNVNGAITLNSIGGSVVANTVNGNVIVGFKKITPDAPMAFTTLNGNVDITFPPDTKANVKLKSDRGEIYTDFDVDVDKTHPKVNKTSEEHMYRLSVEDWVYGKINGGGPEMMMKNMDGNIFIRKSK
jgi:hypothetical protein